MYTVRAGSTAETVVRHSDQLRRRQVMPYASRNPAERSPARDIDSNFFVPTVSSHESRPAASPGENEQLADDPSDQVERTLPNTRESTSAAGDEEPVPAAASRFSVRENRGKPPEWLRDFVTD